MCTAVSYRTRDHYFGRTLDLEGSFEETVTITPRLFPFSFHRLPRLVRHHAIIGMAHVADGYPLYYDAINEKGLSMAGLNFPGNAVYHPEQEGKDNVAPFELIPWVLGQCTTVPEARALLERVNVLSHSFRSDLPATPLHWLIADREEAIVAEPVAEGLNIYDDPVKVMTNNPPFPTQLWNLSNFMGLSRDQLVNRFSSGLDLKPYSRGMGGMGLPGDLSSASRFVKSAFTRLNSVCGMSEEESVSQFFHILGAVEQQRGCVRMEDGSYEITLYTSCCNTDQGIYYYTTYGNRQISAVDLHRENLDGTFLISHPLVRGEQIRFQN